MIKGLDIKREGYYVTIEKGTKKESLEKHTRLLGAALTRPALRIDLFIRAAIVVSGS